MYNKFSNYYDILTFDINYEAYAENIFRILEEHGIHEGELLEIACGTGNLTSQLANSSFEIIAFDNSVDMLNQAFPKLVNLSNVTLVMQDMYDFDYSSYEFDAIVTLLDVVNYILDEGDLDRFFAGVYKGLRPGGIFVFDLNSEDKLRNVLGNNTYVYEKDNIFYSWENLTEGDLTHFYLNFFIEEDGLYSRVEERQTERYYSVEKIYKLLSKLGFEAIKHIDEDTGKACSEKTQRILFQAKKGFN